MHDVTKEIGPVLRGLGFKGSGQHYKRVDDDCVCAVNFQRYGGFYVNLGAHPPFIPLQPYASWKTLKEHDCAWRQRLAGEWSADLGDEAFQTLVDELARSEITFFGVIRTMRTALAAESVDAIIATFTPLTMYPAARTTWQLTRGAVALGHTDTARGLAARALELLGPRDTTFSNELRAVIAGR